MQQLQATFNSLDRNRGGSLSSTEIASTPIAGQRLSAATAKELVKNFDLDRSGEIEFAEFAALNQFVLNLHKAFETTDRDRSGKLDAAEIVTALSYQQLAFTKPTIDKLLKKYSSRSSWGGSTSSSTRGRKPVPTSVTFEQFLLISIHLARIRSIFQAKDTQRKGSINLKLEDLVLLTTEL